MDALWRPGLRREYCTHDLSLTMVSGGGEGTAPNHNATAQFAARRQAVAGVPAKGAGASRVGLVADFVCGLSDHWRQPTTDAVAATERRRLPRRSRLPQAQHFAAYCELPPRPQRRQQLPRLLLTAELQVANTPVPVGSLELQTKLVLEYSRKPLLEGTRHMLCLGIGAGAPVAASEETPSLHGTTRQLVVRVAAEEAYLPLQIGFRARRHESGLLVAGMRAARRPRSLERAFRPAHCNVRHRRIAKRLCPANICDKTRHLRSVLTSGLHNSMATFGSADVSARRSAPLGARVHIVPDGTSLLSSACWRQCEHGRCCGRKRWCGHGRRCGRRHRCGRARQRWRRRLCGRGRRCGRWRQCG
mmetsp:Transcript_21732/g.60709  ORF Transcript_21732/g.60709 Transcript_21732/m.60709 type:complete len:360 (-) Transcript_21732:1450-2529(-)